MKNREAQKQPDKEQLKLKWKIRNSAGVLLKRPHKTEKSGRN